MKVRVGKHVAEGGERLLRQDLEVPHVIQREMLVLGETERRVHPAARLVEIADVVEREQAGHPDPDQPVRAVGLNREFVVHARTDSGSGLPIC